MTLRINERVSKLRKQIWNKKLMKSLKMRIEIVVLRLVFSLKLREKERRNQLSSSYSQ